MNLLINILTACKMYMNHKHKMYMFNILCEIYKFNNFVALEEKPYTLASSKHY